MATTEFKTSNQGKGSAIAIISGGATSLTLQTGEGAKFPSTFPFRLLIQKRNGSNVVTDQEIVTCTNRSGDNFTIVRAVEAIPNTESAVTPEQVARVFDPSSGTVVVTNVFTKGMADEILTNIPKDLKEGIQKQSYTSATATGAVNAFLVALTPALTVYQDGMAFSFKANNTITGSATVNFGGGVLTIRKLGGTSDLASGDIQNGQWVGGIVRGSTFEMQTPVAIQQSVSITTQTEITVAEQNDELLVYSQAAGGNRKVKTRGIGRF